MSWELSGQRAERIPSLGQGHQTRILSLIGSLGYGKNPIENFVSGLSCDIIKFF
jgi:hypothetical protein